MKIKVFRYILIILILIYLIEFFIQSMNNWSSLYFSDYFDECIFITISISYFYIIRRKNILCFELMFLPVFFICIFYNDIVLSVIGYYTSGVGGALDNAISTSSYVLKSRLIQMIGYLFYIYGSSIAYKRKNPHNKWKRSLIRTDIDYKTIIRILVLLLLFQIVLCFIDGSISTWFSYEDNLADEDRNKGLGRITPLCFMSTIVVFIYLGKKGINSFKVFIKNCNKLYLSEILLVSILLIISGNRNEMLLIFLPIVISYSIFINQIPNKIIFSGLILGVILMVYVGLTRQGGTSIELDIFSVSRDFSLVDINCTYLIKYTDEHGPYLFETIIPSILSGIPFIGPLIIQIMGWDMSTQSPYITTAGMAENDTGLGTSIIGDLYYNAYTPFVCIFMFFFGWLMSNLYNNMYIDKKFNLAAIIIYVYMCSNAVYFIRQQWDYPIQDILYSYILLLILFKIFRTKKNDHEEYPKSN